MQEEQLKKIHPLRKWIQQSVSLKLFTISILALCLLIPSSMVKNIIHERSSLNMMANHEVRSKWALSQNICAPIISIPVTVAHKINDKVAYTKSFYHFLPESLQIHTEVEPQKLSRGIFEVIVYNSRIGISGTFNIPSDFDPSSFYEVDWKNAIASIGISDLRGIKDTVVLDWNGKEIESIPGSKVPNLISSGVTFPLDLSESQSINSNFRLNLKLQGSEKLSFIPLGKTTDITMNSVWDSPSFVGAFLPDTREIEKDGFAAEWNVLQINRNYPQHWHDNAYNKQLMASDFGVEFMLPSDSYQKAIRSIKYALMNIALTFLIFFIVEVFAKRKIHPFQYVMVGLSIVLFYVLLVSISEHLSFDQSYLISATATISMIYLYSLSVFKSLKFSLFLLALSILNYAFIYITLQMTEYALLLGALSMTMILSAVMYGTRNINWYKIQKAEE